MMLTGIKAFEARWQSLKSSYATSSADNRTLMQAMGRLVDNYATHEEISEDLSDSLSSLFDQLVDAYLNGCWLDDVETTGQTTEQTTKQTTERPQVSPALLAAQQMRQRRKIQPTPASEAETYVVRDRAELSVGSAFGSAFS